MIVVLLYVWYGCGMFVLWLRDIMVPPMSRSTPSPGSMFFSSCMWGFMCFDYMLLHGHVCTIWMEINHCFGDQSNLAQSHVLYMKKNS